MKTLIMLFAMFWCSTLFGMAWREPIVVSAADLGKKGFVVEAKEEHGVIRSLIQTVSVPKDTTEERFLRMKLVITDDEVSQKDIEAIDSIGESVRAITKEERNASFTLFGRDVTRAYFRFEYQCPSERGVPHYRRYLISMSEIAKANHGP